MLRSSMGAAVLLPSAGRSVAVLITRGKHDQIFPPAGAEPYKRDLKAVEYHLLDAGHFALETNDDEIAKLMRAFLGKHVGK